MQQPGRTYSAGSQYRYGFNGKEDDKDISEGGQDYGMRIYDTRIGKFLSVDPLMKKYPFYSPYQFAGNSPLMSVDIDGLESSNDPNQNEKDAAGNTFLLPAGAKIIDRLDDNNPTKQSGTTTNSVQGGVGTFSIDDKTFKAKFSDGKFTRYATDEGETYNPDNYVFGGSTQDISPYFKADWQHVDAVAAGGSGRINFRYFGFNSNIEFASAHYYNNSGNSFLNSAIDLGVDVAAAKGGASVRLGTTNNNASVGGDFQLFSANARLSGGVFSGENNKYGIGADVGAGTSVAEGTAKFGATFLGLKLSGTVSGDVVCAQIGIHGGTFYDDKKGNLTLNAGGMLGLGLGGKLNLNVEIPVRDWANTIYSTWNYLFH
jgi:RHS repeat-associated protein